MVYVQDIDGKPMMPTTRHGKVRRLLKDNKAVVVNTCPFTIKLMYKTSDYKQEIVLGVDSGTKHVGLSATTKSKELYARRLSGQFNIRDINGENKKDVSCKKLKYVSHGLVSVKTNLFLSQ